MGFASIGYEQQALAGGDASAINSASVKLAVKAVKLELILKGYPSKVTFESAEVDGVSLFASLPTVKRKPTSKGLKLTIKGKGNGDLSFTPETDLTITFSDSVQTITMVEGNSISRFRYEAADTDGDGEYDRDDNCVLVKNPGQQDTDNDAIGDVCDEDIDGDGVDNEQDNCVVEANPGQGDTDGDGIGDVCDSDPQNDRDQDGVANDIDNCPDTPNPGQLDADGNGVGDACEPPPPPTTDRESTSVEIQEECDQVTTLAQGTTLSCEIKKTTTTTTTTLQNGAVIEESVEISENLLGTISLTITKSGGLEEGDKGKFKHMRYDELLVEQDGARLKGSFKVKDGVLKLKLNKGTKDQARVHVKSLDFKPASVD